MLSRLFSVQEMMEEMDEVEVVSSWSAPRSLSTCLMYSFAQVSQFSPLYIAFGSNISLLCCHCHLCFVN